MRKSKFLLFTTALLGVVALEIGVRNVYADDVDDTQSQMETDYAKNVLQMYPLIPKEKGESYYPDVNQYLLVNREYQDKGHFILPKKKLSNKMTIDSQEIKEIPGSEKITYTRINKGSTEIFNKMDYPQVVASSAETYTETYEDSVTKVGNFDFGVSANTPLSKTFGGSRGSFNYSWGKSSTQTETRTMAVTIPSQNIRLEPGEGAEINYILEKGTGSVDYSVSAKLSGNASTTYKSGYPKNFARGFYNAASLQSTYSTFPEKASANYGYYVDENNVLSYEGVTTNKLRYYHNFNSRAYIEVKNKRTGQIRTQPVNDVKIIEQ